MYRYIYGFDKSDPVSCVRHLRKKGISAIVADTSAASLADVFMDEGIDLYLCYGAYSLGEEYDSDVCCTDASGKSRIWFSSGCPNERILADARMEDALSAPHPGIKGIFVDGARFASFASAEGTESFFTCFCPRCQSRMRKLGYNPELIRHSVARLASGIADSSDIVRLSEWLAFRSGTVKAYMDRFVENVHTVSHEIKAGAFIFEPMLAPFVGQTADACASLDIVAPMLYRNYPHETGPACMNHEWSAFARLPGNSAELLLRAAGTDASDIPLCSYGMEDASDVLRNGFTTVSVGQRIACSKSVLRPGQALWPILQIEDVRLKETDLIAFQSGADAVGYFAYGQAQLPDMA